MNASGGVPGYAMNQEWLCHKYDVNYMIMQSNMTMNAQVMYMNDGKLHGNISRNGYGNAIIGRYGGCFEEDIRRFMCDRAYRITGFGCTGEVCTNSQGEKGQCTVPKRLAMMEG
ncbi:hypothetical protein T12_16725 [Trichinella patagoniensis]|uniref:Uncharacterized protein n=1 Tax=Trichinella patagoniensis TaxID=990121 RepID=A0A0V0Z158_9BILA|nr:hypothetical protein T12_16725 [Trichinella patagoniensis]